MLGRMGGFAFVQAIWLGRFSGNRAGATRLRCARDGGRHASEVSRV